MVRYLGETKQEERCWGRRGLQFKAVTSTDLTMKVTLGKACKGANHMTEVETSTKNDQQVQRHSLQNLFLEFSAVIVLTPL